MYCKNCGHYIPEGNKDYCDECFAMQAVDGHGNPQISSSEDADIASPASGKNRLACGILSSVMGQAAFILSVCNIRMIISFYLRLYANSQKGFSILLLIIWLLIAAGTVLGVIAILNFSYARKRNYKKPVATLVTGIVGLVWCVLSVLFQLLCNV